MVTHRALHVWRRNFSVYLTHYKPSLVGNIGEPLLYLFTMGMGLGGYMSGIGGMPYINYIAPGLIVTTAMYSAVFECTFGSFTRMTVQGTYESIISTPVSLADLVVGEIMWGMTKSMISATVMVIVMTLFGLYAPGPGFLGIAVTVAFTGTLFAAAAICFSAISPSYDFFDYFFTLAVAPMFFLSGVFFPLDQFPDAVKWLSLTLPATHSVNLIRFFFHGSVGEGLVAAPVFLAAGALFFTWLAVRLVRKRIVV
ncbi:MAG: ABC transporter permease [Nitrospinae bacterium]|nr:ABC transporter permease [Nitrospinota bacterium]